MRSLTDRLNSIVQRAGGYYTMDYAEGEVRVNLYTDDSYFPLILGEYGEAGADVQLTMLEQHLTSEGL